MHCKTCKKEMDRINFYQGFDKCKKCLGEYLNDFSNEVACVKVKELLHNYNYIINQELLDDIFFGDKDKYRGISNSSKLSEYLKMINSLPQYKDYRYRVIDEEKSDIDFVNDDIKQLKKNIDKAIQNGDFNAHNKWMNCLRDAIELREKLNSSHKWEEKVSKYKTDGKDMISIWEQKGKEIRNIRKFEVISKPCINIKLDENYTIDGDTLIIPVKINEKDCNIYGKRIGNEWVLPSGTTIKCN